MAKKESNQTNTKQGQFRMRNESPKHRLPDDFKVIPYFRLVGGHKPPGHVFTISKKGTNSQHCWGLDPRENPEAPKLVTPAPVGETRTSFEGGFNFTRNNGGEKSSCRGVIFFFGLRFSRRPSSYLGRWQCGKILSFLGVDLYILKAHGRLEECLFLKRTFFKEALFDTMNGYQVIQNDLLSPNVGGHLTPSKGRLQ